MSTSRTAERRHHPTEKWRRPRGTKTVGILPIPYILRFQKDDAPTPRHNREVPVVVGYFAGPRLSPACAFAGLG